MILSNLSLAINYAARSNSIPANDIDLLSGVLDPRISLTRASSATRTNASGMIETVLSNVARFDYDPVTLAPKGLLIEEQRTNLLTYSSEFDNAVWSKRFGSTVNANTLIAPDGTLTADTHTNTDTTTNGTRIRKNGAFAADDTVYCASCYFKQGSQPIASITMYSKLTPGDNLSVIYDLNAGTYTLSNIGSVSGGTAGMENIGNGWWRVWASANMLTGSDTTGIQFIPSVWAIPSAIGSEYGYIWGAQIEAGAFPTSYIPTTSATVTRAADIPVLDLRDIDSSGTPIDGWLQKINYYKT